MQEGKVLLVRHSHEHLTEMLNKGLIEEYQSFQSKTGFLDCKYIISFIGIERNQGIFFGIYGNEGILRDNSLPKYSKELARYIPKQNPKTEFYIQFTRIQKFDKYKDRLVIDWMVPRGWYNNYREVKGKEVVKILPFNYVRDFPGLMNVKLSFDDLKKIIENPESHEEWCNSLTRLQAVYLILDTKSGSQYVGTTYGQNGLWQRWESYIKGDGTGGNNELIDLKRRDIDFYHYLQFSILEVISKIADQKLCIEKETLWKEKLGSRVFGLNTN